MSTATGDEISDVEIPLLNDAMPGSVDFNGRPTVRSKSGCWRSAYFLIGIGVVERFAYYGISGNLLSYLTGRLGQPTATAASILNAWYGTSSLLPILGAFVADSFSGRYRMIIVACVLYTAGLAFMSLSALLNSSDCKADANNTACSPTQLQMIFFFCSFYLVALAQGGHTPCVEAFGADQFDDGDENERKAKSSFFNWWNCFSTGGNLVPLLLLTYIQENVSWALGFGIPAIVVFLSLVVFLTGSTTYRFRINNDERNPFVRIIRVFVKAARNWQATVISLEEEGQGTIPHDHKSAQFKFLDKALLAPDGSMGDEKMCSMSDVEDAKAILRLAPIWFASLGYSIIFAQPSTLFTKQASTMERHITSSFQIPAASLQQYYITVSIAVGLVTYDRIFVPIARAITKKPSGISMLQRIGIGFFLSLSSIVFAALVERKRLATAVEYGLVDNPKAVIPMNVWWLVPQYVLSGIADVFAMVGLQEYFYDQVPCDLKSIGFALYLSIFGIGNLLSSFLVSTIQKATSGHDHEGWFADNLNKAHLDYFYWLLAGFSACGLAAFICFTRSSGYRTRISC